MPRYFGIGKQTAFGTGVAPTKFTDVLSASANPSFEKVGDFTLSYRGRVIVAPGVKYAEPEVETYLWPEGGLEWILRAFMQKHTTSTLDATNGVYQHLYTPATMDDAVTYYTLEIGHDAVTALRIPDAVCDSLEFSFSSEDVPTLSASFVSNFPSTVSAATPSYPAVRNFQNPDVDVRIAGSSVELQELSIECSNNLERFHNLAAALTSINPQALEVSGSFSVRFKDTTHLNRFLNNTETSLMVTLTGPVAGGTHNYKLEINIPRIVYDTWAVDVSGADLLVEDVDFFAAKPSADDIIQFTLVNKVSSL